MAKVAIKNPNDIIKMLDNSTTSGAVSDEFNIFSALRASVQVIGDGATIATSLDGTNYVNIEASSANKILAIPHLARYVKATKSADTNAVTVILAISWDGPIA